MSYNLPFRRFTELSIDAEDKGLGRNAESDFHGKRYLNKTHESCSNLKSGNHKKSKNGSPWAYSNKKPQWLNRKNQPCRWLRGKRNGYQYPGRTSGRAPKTAGLIRQVKVQNLDRVNAALTMTFIGGNLTEAAEKFHKNKNISFKHEKYSISAEMYSAK